MNAQNITGEIVLFSLGPEGPERSIANHQTIQALIDSGFRVRTSAKVLNVLSVLSTPGAHMVVLDATGNLESDGFVLTSVIRSTFDTGILLIVGPTSLDRARGLDSGADICVSAPAHPAEIAAALRALERRAGRQLIAPSLAAPVAPTDAPAEDRWVLERKGWSLRAPNGRRISLTSSERLFLQRSFQDPGKMVRREDWLHLRAKNSTLPEADSNRAIDVLVNRLRRKAALVDAPLPLRAWRKIGYQFTDECTIHD